MIGTQIYERAHMGILTNEGQHILAGEVIGYTCSTGNASPDAPHLHFAVYELSPDKHWWQGRALDPYPLLEKLLQNDG